MRWVFNPFTGTFDAADATAAWIFNPFTGTLDKRDNTGGWIFNPFTGTLDSVAGAPIPPPPGTYLLWGAGNNLAWGVDKLTWG